ncbi:MAG: hypothetical protein JXB49_34580 [Bacteroidales bacterium]|nr:hypothetical protein [Bacteroidales bacterium]
MDTQINEFIDILTDNRLVIKLYTPETISIDDPRFDNFKFNEDLLLSENELEGDELLFYLQQELPFIKAAMSFKLNGSDQPSDLEDMLESELEKFRMLIISNYNAIYKNEFKEIVKEIKGSRSELEEILFANRLNNNPLLNKLIAVKLDFCAETIRLINFQLPVLPLSKETAPKVPERQKRPFETLTCLTQNEIIILAHYLRELGYIGKEMTKIEYAKHFSALTGFAAEKIRQDLSHISKKSDSLESTEFLEKEYSKVRRALDEVIAAIKKDSDEKFSSKP